MNHIGLDGQVVLDELRGIGTVGVDAAHFRRSQEDVLRLFECEKVIYGALIRQVEIFTPHQQQIIGTEVAQSTDNRRPNQAPMTRNKNSCLPFHQLLPGTNLGRKACFGNEGIALGFQQIGHHDLGNKLMERNLRVPPQLGFCLAGIAQKRFYFR